MWLSKLPDPGQIHLSDKTPSFSENVLFTEKLYDRYHCPEHTSSFGILTILRGDGSVSVNSRPEQLNQEKFWVINSGSHLAIDIPQAYSTPALLFFRSQLPEVVAASLSKDDEQLLDNPAANDHSIDFSLLERVHRMNERLKSKLSLLTELGGSSSSFAALKADLIVRSVVEDLIIKNNLAAKESLNIRVKKKSTRTELCKRLYTAKDWLDTNYTSPVTLDDLAAIACMNSQHFLRTFKQLFSVTPHRYLVNARLEYAKRLLMTTSEPVHSVCRDSGMESVSSFSWLFRQRFGVSPSQFRKNKILHFQEVTGQPRV